MVSEKAYIGENVIIKDGVIVEDGAHIGDNCYLDCNCVIRSGVNLGEGSYVGPFCILGEHNYDFYREFKGEAKPLFIGAKALIRSHSVIYGGSTIGAGLQTGHHVTIREKTKAGIRWRVGTLSDIQGTCEIGDYVSMHSNVHIGMHSKIGNYVWIFPYTVLTNDPTPPSETLVGCTLSDYSVVATNAIVLPGVFVGEGAFVGAAAVVTKDVPEHMVAVGAPAKIRGEVSIIKNPKSNEPAYPWPYHFERGMPWEGVGFEKWLEGRSNE